MNKFEIRGPIRPWRSAAASLAISALTLGSACRSTGSSSRPLTENLPAGLNDTAVLGQAYDSTKKKLLTNICVTSPEGASQQGNASGEIHYDQSLSFDSILKKIDGNLSGSARLILANASAEARIASDSATDDRSESHMVYWIGVNRKRGFTTHHYELTPVGQHAVATARDTLQDHCGDNFVTEIQYGASIFATLKIDYMSISDKFQASGGLSVDLAAGVIKGNANLAKLDQDLKKRTKVSLIAKQLGGRPTTLLRLLPGDAVACTLDDLQPCMDAFTKLVDYMRNDFATMLNSPGGDDSAWNVVRFVVASYTDSGLDVLTPSGGFLVVDQTTATLRAQLTQQYLAETANAKRAEDILQNAQIYPYLSAAETTKINDISISAHANIDRLAVALSDCFDRVRDCANIANATLYGLPVYDASLLSVDLGAKRLGGGLYYYNIVGGYQFGGKYDDGKSDGAAPVTRIDLNTQPDNAKTGAIGRLIGVRLTLANGKSFTHGTVPNKAGRSLDLRGDQVKNFQICYDAGSDVPTPRVVGLVINTRGGRALAAGNIIASKCQAFSLPESETFVGMAGSSGTELDSVGIITRPNTAGGT